MIGNRIAAAAPLLIVLLATGCGYHAGGKAETIPQNIKTIAVLPFSNLSSRYRLPDTLQQAISREFIARTRFQVVRNTENADAILGGVINGVLTFPVVFDPATSKTTVVQVSVTLQLYLKDKNTGAVLYSRPPFEVRNNSEISVYNNQYFDESNLSLDRVADDLAKTVVSGIVENF